ncbi:SUKH-4 family immunity protein [Actinoplanes sp. NPDC051411]|uniref:SUKH-4 family immunity protein n=1 Tax=Actinoplanes sp. NPDC051411 TaxID=3155522 RepID=UPI0034151866
MIGDERIEDGLAPLRPVGYGKVPVEGKWRHAPFEDRAVGDRLVAVLSIDPGVALLAVDRNGGEMLLIDDDGSVQLINSSVELLVRCSEAYRKARRSARRIEDDDAALEELAARTLAEVEQLDPGATRDENQLWPSAIEEIECGI